MWRFVMPQLVTKGYTVLVPDLRGLGDTTKPAIGYEKTVVADDIRALVHTLNLGPTINLVGHDMGGMVSYAYAAHPTKFAHWQFWMCRSPASIPGIRSYKRNAPGTSASIRCRTCRKC
jgi:pimeloyl-ACP methyl ester carboxylesterase